MVEAAGPSRIGGNRNSQITASFAVMVIATLEEVRDEAGDAQFWGATSSYTCRRRGTG
jgi:hypothetical protein